MTLLDELKARIEETLSPPPKHIADYSVELVTLARVMPESLLQDAQDQQPERRYYLRRQRPTGNGTHIFTWTVYPAHTP